jgi:DNA polymerase
MMRYATDTSTQALCLCWSYDDEEEVHLWHRGHPWINKSARPDELLERIAAGELFEAHNAKFEYGIWNYVLMREFPEFDVPLKMEQMRCSAAKASCVSLPRSLGDAGLAVGLTERKDPDGQRLINKLSKPMRRKKGDTTIEFCEEEIEHRRNWAYCQQDVRTERALSNFCPEMSERELQYWQMDFRMNMRGVRLDHEAAKEAIKMCATEVTRLDAEMAEITDGEVPGGSKRIPFRKWVNKQIHELADIEGHDIEEIPDTRADTLSFRLYGVPTKAGEDAKLALKPKMEAKWLGFGDRGAKVKRAMEICLEVNRSSVSKFKTMNSAVCPDGRLHDIMLYNGADRTGRWSGQGVQPHNFVRGYSKDMPAAWHALLTLDPDLVTLVTGDLMLPALAKACRGCLIASEGYELYAADFNAIEARKLAWLAGCAPLLTLFQTGGDPYIDMACAIYKLECDMTDPNALKAFKKEHSSERQLGKRAVLGLGYAMGWEKFQATVYAEEGIWLDDDFCKLIVKIYRKDRYPEIPKLWKAYEKAAIEAVLTGEEQWVGGDANGVGAVCYFVAGRFLHCQLPSGRYLAYLDPEVHTKVNYRFPAINDRGTITMVTFPSKPGVPMNRVKRHAEQLAKRQGKILTGDAPESFTTPHLSFMGRHIITKQWQRLGTHGGTLVENVDQASSRDLLAEAMYRVDQGGTFDLLLSIHDEVIAEAPIGTASVKEFEAIMSEVPLWAPGMPISAEGWIGPRLRK